MQKQARVVRIDENGATQIAIRRGSACEACHSCADCSGCSMQQQLLLATATNPIGAKPGDAVLVETPSSRVLLAAVIVYLLPIAFFFAGYAAFAAIDASGALGGGIGFVLAIALAVGANRLMKKSGRMQYVLTGYVKE